MEEIYPFLPVQIIHRDPNPDNILCRKGKVVGFLDFDLARILPRIFDLAYAATGILSDVFETSKAEDRMAFFETAHALWQGYHSRSPLGKEEWQALPDMVISIQMICVAAFSGSDKLVRLQKTNQDMLRMILEHENTLGNIAQ